MKENKKNVSVSINLDTTPILYTDNVNISANADGVVLNVTQNLASSGPVRIVARIGMSRNHAKKLVEKLGHLLLKSEGQLVTGKKIIN